MPYAPAAHWDHVFRTLPQASADLDWGEQWVGAFAPMLHTHHVQRLLDLGCGTGTLTMMVKHRYPRAHVVGLDGDPKILAIARQKAEKEGITLTFEGAMAFDLPYAEGSFDRVLSSLVFHHLTREDKRRTFAECFRVLRPGAELHIADWGRPHNLLMWLASWSVRLFDGPKTTTDNLHGRLTELCRGAGFVDVVEGDRFATIFGTLSMYTAQKPQ
jgi:ubiquinone/menaquinone biosynthesis C-methylase UbiE